HGLRNFDVVLSSTSGFAKGVMTNKNTLHVSYCYTPPRYLWSDAEQYIADLPHNRLIKAALPRLIGWLRQWDKMSASRVQHFIANSQTVQLRIKKYYRRMSQIIYPPVEINLFSPSTAVDDYYVAGGRLVPYKSLDIAIQVFNRLGWPLRIFGTGPEEERLQKM